MKLLPWLRLSFRERRVSRRALPSISPVAGLYTEFVRLSGIFVGILFARCNPKPAECAEGPDDCSDAQPPLPAEMCAKPRSNHWREQTDPIAAGVHDRSG